MFTFFHFSFSCVENQVGFFVVVFFFEVVVFDKMPKIMSVFLFVSTLVKKKKNNACFEVRISVPSQHFLPGNPP